MTVESRRASQPQPPEWLLDAFNEDDQEYARIAWTAMLSEGCIYEPNENSVTRWDPFLAIPLPGVGVADRTHDAG